jgi:hypothetical protein
MKNLTRALTIAAVLAAPAFAQDEHQHSDTMQDNAMQETPMETQDQGITAMQDHMEEMQALMDRIKQEQNPEKRQELMQEHMIAMQKGMQAMHRGMEGMEGMEGMTMEPKNMERCMSMMNKRMDMMQKMMDQMKDHQMESKKPKAMGHM